jgi:hypothetical protein
MKGANKKVEPEPEKLKVPSPKESRNEYDNSRLTNSRLSKEQNAADLR